MTVETLCCEIHTYGNCVSDGYNCCRFCPVIRHCDVELSDYGRTDCGAVLVRGRCEFHGVIDERA